MSKAVVFIFFFIIFSIHLGQLFGITSRHDSVERRGFAKFPEVSDPELISNLDTYFKDNFGFRNVFIKQYLFLKLNLLKTNKAFNTSFDTNGMIFNPLGPDRDYGKYYQNLVYTEKQLDDFKEVFEKERNYLKQKNIPYFVVLIPDRRVVYNDSLPFQDKISVKRHYQFVDFMKQNSDVEVIDVTDAFRNADKKYPLFYKTDTHWTNFGAFQAYKEIMKSLNKYKKVEALKDEDFKITLEKYDLWVGDGGMNYPFHPGKPEAGVDFKLKNESSERKKLNSVLVYGDSMLNFSRTVFIPDLISEIPEAEPLIPMLFRKPGNDKLVDTNPDYYYPKDKIENLVPLIRKEIKSKKVQDHLINYLLRNSIFPEVVGLDFFMRLSFATVAKADDVTFKLDQSLVDQYKPDLVIREITDNRLWEYYRLKCNYEKDNNFNKINKC